LKNVERTAVIGRSMMYTEIFNTRGGDTNAAVYFNYSQKSAIVAEVCSCPDPLKCKCEMIEGPTPKARSMDKKLFGKSRPYLMYSIQRGDYTSTRYSFFCKTEKELNEEILRLNVNEKKSKLLWWYLDEEVYNAAVLSDHRLFLEKMSEAQKYF
jgi:hypothetical protein